MLLDEIDFRRQTVGQRHVIRVHYGDITPLREKTAGITSPCHVAVRYVVERDSVVDGGVAGSDGFRLILRPEVNDDELKVPVGLFENALDGFPEEALDIADHHYDRNDGFVPLSVAGGIARIGTLPLQKDRITVHFR